MPDNYFVPALLSEILLIRRIAMTLEEYGHVVPRWPIVVGPPRRRGERKAPHVFLAGCLDGFQLLSPRSSWVDPICADAVEPDGQSRSLDR